MYMGDISYPRSILHQALSTIILFFWVFEQSRPLKPNTRDKYYCLKTTFSTRFSTAGTQLEIWIYFDRQLLYSQC